MSKEKSQIPKRTMDSEPLNGIEFRAFGGGFPNPEGAIFCNGKLIGRGRFYGGRLVVDIYTSEPIHFTCNTVNEGSEASAKIAEGMFYVHKLAGSRLSKDDIENAKMRYLEEGNKRFNDLVAAGVLVGNDSPLESA